MSRRASWLLGVVAGALCAFAIACAAGAKSTSMAPPAPSAAGTMPPSPQDQIRELDRGIADARQQMGLGAEPLAMPPCVGEACPHTQAMSTAPTVACHPQGETCTSSCNFADSICTNAQKICDLAKQLGNDAWANGRCAAGEASCKEAKDRCCGCR